MGYNASARMFLGVLLSDDAVFEPVVQEQKCRGGHERPKGAGPFCPLDGTAFGTKFVRRIKPEVAAKLNYESGLDKGEILEALGDRL